MRLRTSLRRPDARAHERGEPPPRAASEAAPRWSAGPALLGYTYKPAAAYAARDAGRLLCLRLATNDTCNLRCHYCYADRRERRTETSMRWELARDILDQAASLGVRSVVYLGGEPLLYAHFWSVLRHMAHLGVIPVVFTNGLLVTRATASRLLDLNASVLVKRDGSAASQNRLTSKGTFESLDRGLRNLIAAGLADQSMGTTRLGIASCVTRVNIGDIPDLWRLCRSNNIFPNMERMTVVRSADRRLALSALQAARLYDELRRIDEEEFGFRWPASFSGIPAHSCFIPLSGASVDARGGVSTCPELPAVASLRNATLAEVLGHPAFLEQRQLDRLLPAPCRSCAEKVYCLGGCRSKAIRATGSATAPDPDCSRVREASRRRQSEGPAGSTPGSALWTRWNTCCEGTTPLL